MQFFENFINNSLIYKKCLYFKHTIITMYKEGLKAGEWCMVCKEETIEETCGKRHENPLLQSEQRWSYSSF